MPLKKPVQTKEENEMNLRELLGLSQPELAEFCGVSRSLLSMVEIQHRSWPSGSPLNHTWLLGAFVEAEKNPPDLAEVEKPKHGEVAAWQKEIRQLRLEIEALEQNIEALQFRYRQARRLYQTSLTVRKHFPDPDQTENLVLNLWLQKAGKKMRQNGPLEVERLQLKIESAQKQIDLLLNWIARSLAS